MSQVELPKCRTGDFKMPKCPMPKTEPVIKTNMNKIKPAAKRKLPELVSHKTRLRDLRERIATIKTTIKNKPPAYRPVHCTRIHLLRQNALVFMNRTRHNIQLLVEVAKTKQTHGFINPFRYEHPGTAISSIPLALTRLNRIDEENFSMAKRLESISTPFDSNKQSNVGEQHFYKRPFRTNEESLRKYENLTIEMPKTDQERWRLFRPRVYFDIYVKDVRPLGRIVIELYTEAAPYVVLEIVQACMSHKYQRVLIKRVFPNLWVDMQIPLKGNSQLVKPLEYDGKIIDHGSSSYVLSFSKAHLKGFRQNLSFSISLKPLSVVNGTRVGFGKVIKGGRAIDCLQTYGTKNGKLNRTILFTGCGVI